MIIGARQGVLNPSESAGPLVFHTQQSLEFADNCAKKTFKNPVSSSYVGKNALIMKGQRRRARLVEADQRPTVTQITTHYNSGMQKSISEHNNMSNL